MAGSFLFNVEFGLQESLGASLILDFGNDEVREFGGPVERGMTVIEALYSSSMSGNFEIRYHVDKNGDVNLDSIDESANIGPAVWQFYINGKQAPTKDLGRIKVGSGDIIEAHYGWASQ